jgi:hypothetical protein
MIITAKPGDTDDMGQAQDVDRATRTQLDTLVSLGRAKKSASHSGGMIISPIPTWVYASKGNQDFCYARVSVDHVENFTVPGDMMGHQITEVTYYQRVERVSDWANIAKVRSAFPEIEQNLTKIKTEPQKITLGLTNSGWEAMGS